MRTLLLFFGLFLGFTVYAQDDDEWVTKKMLKKIRAIDYKLDMNNGDGVFIAQHRKTKKWGMFQAYSEKVIEEKIPMQYDSIDFFGFNAYLTGVWIAGKVGIYTSPWSFAEEDVRQSVDCLYDDYKIFEVGRTMNDRDGYGSYKKYFTYVAVKRDGLWAWIDWQTGELMTEFEYDLEKEKMPYPLWEQVMFR
jgi:hypothetical protein